MTAQDRTSEFVGLFATADRGVYKYILTLVGDIDSTQEILQESSVTLWEKFGEFQPGTNFLAWACSVAYFEVLKFRQTHRRDRLRFNDGLLDTLAAERSGGEGILQTRRLALPDCMARLPANDRELIEQRYASEETILEIARRTGRPANTLYKALERIRRTLMKCIDDAVAQGDGEPRKSGAGSAPPSDADGRE